MKRGGGVVCFEIEGGYDRAKAFIDGTQMLSRSANLGDTRTIVTHPASTTHSKLTEDERLAVGITPGLIRIAVGLEHHEDIIRDIKQALGEIVLQNVLVGKLQTSAEICLYLPWI